MNIILKTEEILKRSRTKLGLYGTIISEEGTECLRLLNLLNWEAHIYLKNKNESKETNDVFEHRPT